MNKKITIGLIIFILLLILFDAVQQKYYVETFGLLAEGRKLSLSYLLQNHFIRWFTWALMSLPSGYIIRNVLTKKYPEVSAKTISLLAIVILSHTFISIVIISAYDIYEQELVFSAEMFRNFFVFFTFQKGLIFVMASITLSMILYNRSHEKTIESQFVEITNLKRKSTDLEEALNMTTHNEPHLNIKTGNKFQPIPLRDIVWIQSDDYCVKIHTEDKAFTLRKSMKALEEQLAPYSFIRVHRIALLNMNFLQQINFETATIQLSNTTEIPLSRTGAKALKKKLEQSSL